MYNIYIYIYAYIIYIFIYIFNRTLLPGFHIQLYTIKKLNLRHMHHVSKCLMRHKDILVMIRREHCFHDYICVMAILLHI